MKNHCPILKVVAVLSVLLITNSVFAQNVAINATGATPDNSAMLDVVSTNKGLLIPRVSLTSLADGSTITSPATSLLIYNSNASLSGGIGYYYNAGTSGSPNWVRLSSSNEWKLNGNTGTTAGANYIGTADSTDLILKANGVTRIKITAAGVVTIGDGTNQSKIDADGSLRFEGTATFFDDMLFPLLNSSTATVTFSPTEVAMQFPNNDTTKEVYIVAQLPHQWKEGSAIYPHVHWKQTAATAVKWQMSYKWFNIGDAVPSSWTNLATTSTISTYSSGSMSQISDFLSIDGTGKTISSLLLVRLYRNDNTTSGNVFGYQFDIHVEKDALGSRTLYAK